MQFNVDCAIDIMNYIIDNQTLDIATGKLKTFLCKNLYEADKLQKYSKEVIYYTLLLLIDGKYVDAVKQCYQGKQRIKSINGLTLRGHEFCEHMKEPTTADKVKNGLKEIGKHSLSYAESVIKECLVASSKEVTKIAIQQSGLL